jgi:hypothetical protein
MGTFLLLRYIMDKIGGKRWYQPTD